MRIFETEILKSLTLNDWSQSLKLGNTQNPSFYSNVVSGSFSAINTIYHSFLSFELNTKRLWSFFGSNAESGSIPSSSTIGRISKMTVVKNKYTYSENKKSDILCCITTNNKVLLTTNPKNIEHTYDFSRFGDSTQAPSVLHDIDNNNEYVYVVGEDGYIAYSNDNGYTFNQIQFEYPLYFGCVVAFPGVYVSTYNKNVTAIACSRPMQGESLLIAIISNDEIVDYRVFSDTSGIIDVTYKNNSIIGISQGQPYYSTTFLYDIVNKTYSNLYNIDREEQYEILGIENINGKLIVLSNNNRLLKSENGQVWEEEDLSAYLPSSHNFRGIAKYGNMVSLVTEDGYVLYKNF